MLLSPLTVDSVLKNRLLSMQAAFNNYQTLPISDISLLDTSRMENLAKMLRAWAKKLGPSEPGNLFLCEDEESFPDLSYFREGSFHSLGEMGDAILPDKLHLLADYIDLCLKTPELFKRDLCECRVLNEFFDELLVLSETFGSD